MFYRRKKRWELPENATTPESTYLNRRDFSKSIAAGALLIGGAGAFAFLNRDNALAADTEIDPTSDLYPVRQNLRYTVDRPLTAEEDALTYNNFYEFGTHKGIHRLSQKMPLRPWTVQIDGLVEEERSVDIDTLIRAMPLEERIYRHRCVEAWSMTVPWSGFAMKALVDYARPLSSAKYIRMETLADKESMPGLRAAWYPWPYVEGLTIEEATNELAFIGTGLYGKPMPKQNGAPLRLVAPWKYGFKSIKSLVRLTFTDERPVSFWEEVQGREYGFWANVNPEVDHPRWSQATERVLGGDERVPTLLYNGYAEEVAGLYANLKNERLFM